MTATNMSSEIRRDVEMFFPTAVKVVLRILDHHKIKAYLVGEFALNYYNVPDVVHDVEICVPDDRHEDVSAILIQTGLLKRNDYTESNPHIEHKCGYPRLSTSEWLPLPVSFVIFPASFCGLEPLDVNTIRPAERGQGDFVFSEEMLDYIQQDDIKTFCFPRLAPFIKGLAERYLHRSDDMAAVAAEHLVDGMNLSKPWCDEQLNTASPEVVEFVECLVRGKQSRIAYYQDNTVTCMVVDQEQASKLPQIPGYE